jgi:Fur family transcriptional regulator, ferric uptake regulator
VGTVKAVFNGQGLAVSISLVQPNEAVFCYIIGLLIKVAIKEESVSCIPNLTKTLRKRGFRMTSQRLAIMQALHDGGHLSPVQIYARVHPTGMTETTVYRTLEFLAWNGIVYPAQNGSGHLTYELAGHEHHHIICGSCGSTFEVEHELLQKLFQKLETQSGYRMNANHMIFFGLCPVCKQKE